MVTERFERMKGGEFWPACDRGAAEKRAGDPFGRARNRRPGGVGSSARDLIRFDRSVAAKFRAGRSDGHEKARTDGGGRVPPPRGHREPRTDRGRAGRGAALVTDVPERMKGAENRSLVVAGDLKRMGGTPRARAPPARPIRFGLSMTTGPLKRAETIRSSMSMTTAGAAPGTPRRVPIRSGRVVTTEVRAG